MSRVLRIFPKNFQNTHTLSLYTFNNNITLLANDFKCQIKLYFGSILTLLSNLTLLNRFTCAGFLNRVKMKGIWLIIIQFVCVCAVSGFAAKYILSDVEVDSDDDDDDDDSNFCCLFVKVLSKAPKILEKGNSILKCTNYLPFVSSWPIWLNLKFKPNENVLYDDRSLSLMPNIQKLTNTSSSTSCVLCKFSSRLSIRVFFSSSFACCDAINSYLEHPFENGKQESKSIQHNTFHINTTDKVVHSHFQSVFL